MLSYLLKYLVVAFTKINLQINQTINSGKCLINNICFCWYLIKMYFINQLKVKPGLCSKRKGFYSKLNYLFKPIGAFKAQVKFRTRKGSPIY